jgi:uncharacterized protein (TIGR00297 family)
MSHVGRVKCPSAISNGVTSALRRAGGFAAVGTLALAAPALGPAAFAPFAAVGLLAALVITDGPLFELFARPGDRRDGRLNGLAGFALAATGLALLATVPRQVALPIEGFVASVLVVAYGNFGERLATARSDGPFRGAAGFAAVGSLAGFVGQLSVAWMTDVEPGSIPFAEFAVLAASGAIAAALLRSVLYSEDDPLVMLSIGLLVWLLGPLVRDVEPTGVALALALTVAFGYAAYALGTASVTGMLSGIFLGLLTIVLGGLGWFAVLISFFAVGGLSTKFRYDRKRERGVAEDNDGARGSGNVLGNAAVALVAVVGYAAGPWIPIADPAFRYAFVGSIAAAMSDTLSSEIGGLFDRPRLITTLEPVEPGTDGGVTWQGELAGVAGAALVGVIAALLLPFEGARGLLVVVLGGVTGMTVDSLLGATLEGDRLGNQAVNFLATLSGGAASTLLAIFLL